MALAREAGAGPPEFGVITKLRLPARRHGDDDKWQDDVVAAAAVAPAGPPAGCSSTPARAKRAG
jgi:hypothetical protein